jgi:3'-phosphoadenosine 5'-phosphosulfate sulfotransferase (PAPS reductase)/FAD synthetase
MTADPFHIEGPALISFSGGRTSAYMLHRIVDAHGGTLPADVVVAFANTGKERPETLRFVHECATRWAAPVRWVEWRPGRPGFEQVGFNSASRNGEPFKVLIDSKQRLPNGHERWCTEFLKVKPMFALMRSTLGLEPGAYTETIGLRHDEGHRILKGLERAETDNRRVAYPLAKAHITKADVMAFWRAQSFDLGLQPHEGNCDLCFMKGKGLRKRIIRDSPGVAGWWADREREQGGWFDKRDTVAELVAQVRAAPGLFDPADDDEHDVECGLSCATEAVA